jgi:transcriptional regulator with XRE-family HTH domain
MDIVLKLRELRRLRGFTQKEAAELAGIGEKTVSSFETGDRITSIKLSQLLQLLSAYNVTPTEFFGGRVEEQVFRELERLNDTELKLLAAIRRLPQCAREPLSERILLMIDGATMASESRLRAIR